VIDNLFDDIIKTKK